MKTINSQRFKKNEMKLIVSVGAGPAQLPFIKALKEQGHLVAAFGKGKNDINAVKICDYFSEIDTKDSDQAVKWLKGLDIEIAGAGSFAGGRAINTLHEINREFNLPTMIPSFLSVGMNKFEQQRLYEKYELTSIKTFSVDEIKCNPNVVNGINRFIIKPAVGRGSAGVYKSDLEGLYKIIDNSDLMEINMVQEFQEGEEYRMLIIVQNSEIKLFAPIKRESFKESFLLGRLSYNSKEIVRIEQYVNKMIKNLGLKNVIMKADIIVGEKNINMIEMDIGVGGGIYYKTYVSHLFNYDINREYINLIIGDKVSELQDKNKDRRIVMDYIYNLSGEAIHYDSHICREILGNLLDIEDMFLIPNLLHPESKKDFESNADFIFCLIHDNDEISNFELNNYINDKLFEKIKG